MMTFELQQDGRIPPCLASSPALITPETGPPPPHTSPELIGPMGPDTLS